uniref:TF-B3 domain-containing protein n=1 Tax=Oryza punctata TaxID=4537 RepID=A0A0E0JMB4_ORYPU
MDSPRYSMIKLNTTNQDYLHVPRTITQACQLKDGQTISLMTAHGLKIRIKIREISNKLYMRRGWKEFIQATGLKMGESVVFKTSSKSKSHVIVLNKQGLSRCPVPYKSSSSHNKNQSSSVANLSVNRNTPHHMHYNTTEGKSHKAKSHVKQHIQVNLKHHIASTSTVKMSRTIKDMCYCNKGITLSTELKNYIKDIAQFLHHSSKFYIVAINQTFMKQDRVPLAQRKTVDIQVQIADNPSTSMILQKSTDQRYNLKRGWSDFAIANKIQVGTICIFHFYRANQLQATVDVI